MKLHHGTTASLATPHSVFHLKDAERATSIVHFFARLLKRIRQFRGTLAGNRLLLFDAFRSENIRRIQISKIKERPCDSLATTEVSGDWHSVVAENVENDVVVHGAKLGVFGTSQLGVGETVELRIL